MTPLHILIVDDNPINRRLLSVMLGKLDIDVDTAENGKNALDLLIHNLYDFVLMDIHMPVLNGYEATRTIRAMGGRYFENLPVFAIVGIPDENQIRDCGMNGYFMIPLNIDEIYLKITEYLEKHS